jgi:transcriptional regulator GlxA family with amidase domain
LKVVPHQSIDEVPHPTILAVVGGGLPSLQVIGKPFVREYLLSSTPAADIVLGFGTGSVVLAAYGLLNQRPVATHWAFSGLLEAFGARYAGERWVEDGRFITTAGGSAAMDMGLTLLARLAGEKNARMLQLFAEYDPQPPFGGIDWSRVNHDEMVAFPPDQVQALIQCLDRQPEMQRIVQGWAERLSLPAMITQLGRGGIA